MTRSVTGTGATMAFAALVIVAGAFLVWPRYAAERNRALDVGRTWAAQSLPAAAVESARVEVQATMHGWRVVYRDVRVPCAQTSLGCGTSRSDESLVYTDVWACVEYGTGRGYFFGASIRPVGPVGPNTCRRPALPPAPPVR